MLFDLKDLEVNSEAHRDDKVTSKATISRYIASIKKLKEQLTECTVSLSSNDEDTKVSTSLYDTLKDSVPSLIISVAVHTGKHYWTNSESRRTAICLLNDVLTICGCVTVSELLVGITETGNYPRSPYSSLIISEEDIDLKEFHSSLKMDDKRRVVFKNGVLKDILVILKTNLQRSTWKSHPNSKHALIWCLKHLKHPHMEPFIDSFLPPLLMLIDDHEPYHRSLGLSGMNHLISNTDVAILRQYGRSDVIYEAVKHLLYTNDVVVINSLHPCLLSLLPILVGAPPISVKGPRKPSKVDEVFVMFLGCMEMESKLAIRKAYSSHVSGYIELLGIFTVRYLKRVLSILFSYIECPDFCGEDTRLNSLRSLIVLLKHCWPRIPRHSERILKALLKLISDLSPNGGEYSDNPDVMKQFPLIIECLLLLLRCHPIIKSSYENILQESGGNNAVEQCINQALKTADDK